MPKVRLSKDGHYFIRTYRGDYDDLDSGFFGTWQLHAVGEAYLRRHRLLYEGADVSIGMFKDLAAWRYIFSESGQYPVERREPPKFGSDVPTSSTAAKNRKKLVDAKPRLLLTVDIDGNNWRLSITVDTSPTYRSAIAQVESALRTKPQAVLALDNRISGSRGTLVERMKSIGTNLPLRQGKLVLELVVPDRAMGSSRYTLASHGGLNPNGMVFGNTREQLVGRPRQGARLYLVIHRDKVIPANGRLTIPALLSPKRIGGDSDWQCWTIVVPNRDDPVATAYLNRLGVGPPIAPEERSPESKKKAREQSRTRWLAKNAAAQANGTRRKKR